MMLELFHRGVETGRHVVDSLLTGGVGIAFVAVLARLLWHRSQVKLGRRKFFSVELIWELPMAALSGIIGGGIAEYFGLDGMVALAIVGMASWLGPRGLEILLAKLIEKYKPERG